MSITNISKKWPPYTAGIRNNLIQIFDDKDKTLSLNKHQLYGIALALGYSLKNGQLLDVIRNEAKMYLEDHDADACKIASVMMSLNNTFHNFIDSIDDQEIAKLPPEFDMEAMGTMISAEVDEQDMDAYCLAVSILNGCKYWTDYYIAKLIKTRLSKAAVRDVARVVSVLRATVEVLEIERRRSYAFVVRDNYLG